MNDGFGQFIGVFVCMVPMYLASAKWRHSNWPYWSMLDGKSGIERQTYFIHMKPWSLKIFLPFPKSFVYIISLRSARAYNLHSKCAIILVCNEILHVELDFVDEWIIFFSSILKSIATIPNRATQRWNWKLNFQNMKSSWTSRFFFLRRWRWAEYINNNNIRREACLGHADRFLHISCYCDLIRYTISGIRICKIFHFLEIYVLAVVLDPRSFLDDKLKFAFVWLSFFSVGSSWRHGQIK